MDGLLEDDPMFLGRMLLKYAVQRQIFDPYTGVVLDMRRAVLVDGTDHGHKMHIMTADNWDIVKDKFFAEYGKENFDIYDGRVLYGKGKKS